MSLRRIAGPRKVFEDLGGRWSVRDRRWELHSDGRLYDMRADSIERLPNPRTRAAMRTRPGVASKT